MADSLVPMSGEVPDIGEAHVQTSTRSSQLGAESEGEAGSTGAPAAVMNAVNNAVRPLDAAVSLQPFTPEKILRALAKLE